MFRILLGHPSPCSGITICLSTANPSGTMDFKDKDLSVYNFVLPECSLEGLCTAGGYCPIDHSLTRLWKRTFVIPLSLQRYGTCHNRMVPAIIKATIFSSIRSPEPTVRETICEVKLETFGDSRGQSDNSSIKAIAIAALCAITVLRT